MMTFEEGQEMGRKMREKEAARKKELEEIRRKWLIEQGIDPASYEVPPEKWDHPCTPDDGFVTFIYIVAMIAVMIFKDFWIAWIMFTLGYVKFITRHDND